MFSHSSSRGGPLIWPLRGKLFQPIFFQQKPRYTAGRPVPTLPVRPWNKSGQKSVEGVKPWVVHSLAPLPTVFKTIGGQTKDSTGAALGNCVVDLFVTSSDLRIETIISNGDGYYYFKGPAAGVAHYAVAYKAGSPDVAGTTVNTSIGI